MALLLSIKNICFNILGSLVNKRQFKWKNYHYSYTKKIYIIIFKLQKKKQKKY